MSSSKYHVTLTNYARGLAQDITASLAHFLAPDVIVPAATGQYKSFDDKNDFQVVDTSRAVGGPAKRLEFAASDPTYNCLPQALEIAIDDHERDEAGQGDPLRLEEAKTQTLVSSAVTSHEAKVFAMLAAQPVAATLDVTGGDPIATIDAQIESLATDTARLPNRLVIGLPLWTKLRHHEAVLKRFPGAQSVGVTMAQFASLLLNPAIDIRIGILSKDTAKLGKAKDAKNIVGEQMVIFHASQSPTLYDPSFMKTFRTRRGGVDVVRMYRDDSARSDILAVDWSEDIKITSPVCARKLAVG
ncbi:hypothetical protein ASA1KI_23270 [Opitutales bacterium ASA1]|jgi:hypothetical protein|uniref:hypothetical protein n=1 Tax=Congregicoccus parvus TaxID=3081749 RepID=UPI002B2E8AF9|nr:hypothetical protein ASA1KI_23270 [Opitutales bacterium ASA1]